MSGHLGEDKTLSRLRERFYWLGFHIDVKLWCQSCEDWARWKMPTPKHRAPLQNVQVGSPMQVVMVNNLGPLPKSSNGNQYILVAGDYFTRWMEAYAIPNQEADTVAQKLTEEMFSPPEQLHSDQDGSLKSLLVAEVFKVLGIKKTRTTPYHPQGDGLVERFNCTLISLLSTAIKDHHNEWEEHLRATCTVYNTSEQLTTGFTPFYLMCGREARMPIDIMFGRPPENEELSHSEYRGSNTVRQHCQQEFQRPKDHYDRKVHGNPYSEGDLVWLHTPVVPSGQSRKLHQPWTGPFKVVRQLSERTYRIQGTTGQKK